MKTNDRVMVTSGMREFVGATGRVVDVTKDGRVKMFRVRLDHPVMVAGVGLVEDDLWSRDYLKKVAS